MTSGDDRQTFEETQRSITHLTLRVEHPKSQTQGGCHDFALFPRDSHYQHNGAIGSSTSFTATM